MPYCGERKNEGAFHAKTDDWKKELEENYRENVYADSRGTKKRLDEEYAEFKAMLGELGYAK